LVSYRTFFHLLRAVSTFFLLLSLALLLLCCFSYLPTFCTSFIDSPPNSLSTNSSPDFRQAPSLNLYSTTALGRQRTPLLEFSSHMPEFTKWDNSDSHISIKILLKTQKPSVYHLDFNALPLLNSLHYICIFRTNQIVACLVEVERCDIN